MTRQTFSDHVLRDWHRSHLSQTAEEIAEALQIPLHKLLERARRAGIILTREYRLGGSSIVTDPPWFRVGQFIVKASIASPRSSVVDMGFRNPFER